MSYDSWGRNAIIARNAQSASVVETQGFSGAEGWLPFGNGRSYGDSCHNDRGTLIDCRPRNRILGFDNETGILRCEAGLLLSDLLAHVLPRGYFLPVTPGTRYVTIGGAIANDVHGKNHHMRGTFGAHVLSFRLARSGGDLLECTPDRNSAYFSATIGGMGLTGLITEATLRLMRVDSPDVRQRTLRFDTIDGYFANFERFDRDHEYAVAWIDQLASGRWFGRGILMGADHAGPGRAPQAVSSRPWLSVPLTPPVNLINTTTLRAFNAYFFNKERPRETLRNVSWSSYFYPLDAIGHWNRLYGPRGLYQHQSVYPEETGHATTIKLLECARKHGHASFLTVLKRFGAVPSPGLLSFARRGFTLTLDFANQGTATLRLLDALDDIVLQAGGAINPYKDARMSADTFDASFDNWRDLEAMRDPAMMSDFWRRTALRHTDQSIAAQ